MIEDTISKPEKVEELKMGLFKLTKDVNFKKSNNMGELLSNALDFVRRNYVNENPYLIK